MEFIRGRKSQGDAVFDFERDHEQALKKAVYQGEKPTEEAVLIGTSSNRSVFIPSDAKHVFICGTTGSGKTVALSNFLASGAKHHYPMLIIDGKGDTDAGSLLEMARRLCQGRRLYGLIQERLADVVRNTRNFDVLLLDDEKGTPLGGAHQPLGGASTSDTRIQQAYQIYHTVAEELFESRIKDAGIIDLSRLTDKLPLSATATMPSNSTMSAGPEGTKPPADWDWDLTCRFMRKMYLTCLSLQRTLGVMEVLRSLAERQNEELALLNAERDRRNRFAQYYGGGLIGYDDESGCWVYENEDGDQDQLLNSLELLAYQRPYHYYYMMERFYALPDDLFEYWQERFSDLVKEKGSEISERQEALKAQLQTISDTLKANAAAQRLKNAAGDADLVDELRKFYRMSVDAL
ncbi:MAG: FtsK/SpoIIIE domain-containing protein [Oscillospiraceae bacterium]|nr:FtsK/SpoIIIE domain-containing protein [Oscillospiraceae bacterium]